MNSPFVKQVLSVVFINILLQAGPPAKAAVPDETTTIILDQPVHFLGTDGSDVVANPGEYSVEATQEWLRLIPGTERRDALLIEAQPGIHEVKVEIPIVISTPGTEPDETDVHVVQYLNPDGTSMVATGTYSGIRSRGLFDKARQAAERARAVAEAARRAVAAKAQQVAEAARNAALRAKQAAEANFAKPQEARVETSPRVPPKPIKIGEIIQFGDASGYRRKICQWMGGHLIKHNDWGCQSHIDLANGRIQVKADRYGFGLRMNWIAEAWVEIFKDFTVLPQSKSIQEQTKTAILNVPIEYHGKASSTLPGIGTGHYKIVLMLDEMSFDAGPVYTTFALEKRVLEDHTVKAGIVMVKGVPLPRPEGALTTEKNPVYFNAPVIPGRTYRLTLRVEVEARGLPVTQGVVAGVGSGVNFMDKAMIINERQRIDGYIKWGPVKIRINP